MFNRIFAISSPFFFAFFFLCCGFSPPLRFRPLLENLVFYYWELRLIDNCGLFGVAWFLNRIPVGKFIQHFYIYLNKRIILLRQREEDENGIRCKFVNSRMASLTQSHPHTAASLSVVRVVGKVRGPRDSDVLSRFIVRIWPENIDCLYPTRICHVDGRTDGKGQGWERLPSAWTKYLVVSTSFTMWNLFLFFFLI